MVNQQPIRRQEPEVTWIVFMWDSSTEFPSVSPFYFSVSCYQLISSALKKSVQFQEKKHTSQLFIFLIINRTFHLQIFCIYEFNLLKVQLYIRVEQKLYFWLYSKCERTLQMVSKQMWIWSNKTLHQIDKKDTQWIGHWQVTLERI